MAATATHAAGRRSTPSPSAPASPSRPCRGCCRAPPSVSGRDPAQGARPPSTQLDYVPLGAARSLAVRHHEAHGLVLPELTGPYYAELLDRLRDPGRRARPERHAHARRRQGRPRPAPCAASRPGSTASACSGSAAIPTPPCRACTARKPVVLIAGDTAPGIEAIAPRTSRAPGSSPRTCSSHGRTPAALRR